MGRKVTPRLNYRGDTSFLMRLQQAVEIDARIPDNVKRDLIKKIGEISSELMRYFSPIKPAA